jgi:hypothetical protein
METAQRMAAPVNLCRDDSGSRRGRTDDDQLQGKRQFTDKQKVQRVFPCHCAELSLRFNERR